MTPSSPAPALIDPAGPGGGLNLRLGARVVGGLTLALPTPGEAPERLGAGLRLLLALSLVTMMAAASASVPRWVASAQITAVGPLHCYPGAGRLSLSPPQVLPRSGPGEAVGPRPWRPAHVNARRAESRGKSGVTGAALPFGGVDERRFPAFFMPGGESGWARRVTAPPPSGAVWATVRSFLALLARDDEAGEPDWQALLEAAVASVPGAQTGSLNVREGEVFVMRAVVGFDQALLGSLHPEAALRRWYAEDVDLRAAGQPRVLRGAALRSPALWAYTDASLSEHDERFETLGQRQALQANLCLPVVVGGQVVAELNLDNLTHEDAFDPAAVEIAQEFGLLVAAVLAARERRRREAERALELAATRESTLLALGVALEARDLETSGHTERVVRLARALGLALHLPARDLEALTQGAYLHDLGKLSVPDAILHKPGRLTEDEFALMKTHTTRGHQIAGRLPSLTPGALDVVLHHHERWDGTGYPCGLSGAQIPLLARIFAVCDVYDALVSERPYKRAWSHDDALAEIVRATGQHFDPRVVAVFADLDLCAVLRLAPPSALPRPHGTRPPGGLARS